MDTNVDPAMACGLAQCLGQQLDRETFSDFIVRVEDREFKCHRVVLSACSEFFAALLRTDMKESAEGVANVEGIRPDIFGDVLEAVYKGINVLTMDNVFDVWHAANQLQIEFLFKACEEYVIKNISEQTYLEIHRHASLLHATSVLHAVRQMMIRNFERVMLCDAFPELPVEDLVAIVNSYELKVCADGIVQAILRWVSGRNYDGYLRDLGTPESFSENSDSPPEAAAPDTSEKKSKTQIDDNVRDLAPPDESKMEHLGMLFKSASTKIGSMSNECLSLLLTHEILLGCSEALHVIIRIAASRLNPNLKAQKKDLSTYQQKQCSSGKCPLHLHGPIIASFTYGPRH